MFAITLAVTMAAPLPPEVKAEPETLTGWIAVSDKVYLNAGSQLEPRFVVLKFVDLNKFAIVAEADCRRADLTGKWMRGEFWVDTVTLYPERVPPPKEKR